ncbi:trans-3-hydroxy-L-proline dehydratase [Pelobates cultripes]|uniref:trans-L-3-hydroxyproline dehydratase n=1 Tax=Pelobates cultripes TaxID=61616 RepID=A0AAD1WY76_PELCU|nr:trans-3-hydroxy-L-proline dehydratase [Pelobates cultripes]
MSAVKLPPHDGPVLSVVDMHTGGEPVRIVLSGAPVPEGGSLLERRRWLRDKADWLRRLLLLEPRGHRDMYGVLLVPSEEPGAHLGAVFIHTEGYSTMCGHAVIALGRFAVDYGIVPRAPGGPDTPVRIHCPCGPVQAYVSTSGGRSGAVRFHSVPAFTLATDVSVEVPGYGKLVVDIAYGGAFYAFVSAERFGLDVCTSKTRDLVDVAAAVTASVKEQVKLAHPENDEMAFLYGTILTDGNDGYSEQPTANICVFADSQVDRSPTGSGVTARIALQYHKGLIQLDQTRSFRSGATDSVFTGKAVKETTCGNLKAVIVEVSGQAFYTELNKTVPLESNLLLIKF